MGRYSDKYKCLNSLKCFKSLDYLPNVDVCISVFSVYN